MKIIFAGTPEFAVPCLVALLDSKHEVIAVYTQPDRPAGRGQKLTPSPIKQLALTKQIPVYQPVTLRDTEAQQQLRELKPEIMVVVAYGLILPSEILTIPPRGCINVHASLLPQWRGAAPIQRAILAGDPLTGITIMQMDQGLDTGDMLKKVECPIEPLDNSLSLQRKLATLGSEALLATLEDLELGNTHPEKQDATLSSYAKKIDKQEAELNWELSAVELDRMVRGYNPWPIAHTSVQDQLLKIWQAEVLSGNASAGVIIKSDSRGIDVGTGQGILRLLAIQLPGGRCLPVADVLHSKADLFVPGTTLGKKN